MPRLHKKHNFIFGYYVDDGENKRKNDNEWERKVGGEEKGKESDLGIPI